MIFMWYILISLSDIKKIFAKREVYISVLDFQSFSDSSLKQGPLSAILNLVFFAELTNFIASFTF